MVWLHVHFSHYFRKNLVNIHSVLGGRLNKRTSPDLRQSHALHRGNLPLALKVDLVAHEEDGHPLRPLHPHYLVPHGLDVLEGLVVGQAVYHHEALPILDVEIPHAGELLSPRGVQYFKNTWTVVHLNFL